MAESVFNLLDYTCVADGIDARARLHPRDIAVEKPQSLGAEWLKITAGELAEEIHVVGRGWMGLGLQPGDKVSIIGATSYEWVVLDLGAQAAGLVTVPIYESDSPEQIAWILTDAQVKAVVTDNSTQSRIVRSIVERDQLNVGFVFSLDDSGLERILEYGRKVADQELLDRKSAIKQQDLCTIVYTSGTTGRPKGVELTHRNFLAPLQAVMFGSWQGWIYDPDSRVMLFLPVAHVLARFISYQMLVGRGTASYVPNVKNLVNDLQVFRPKALLVVPRVLEKIYNAADATAGHGLKLKMFRWAAKVAEYSGKVNQDPQQTLSRWQRIKLGLARKLVLNKITALMGGNVQGIVSGGAPMADRLGFFFEGCGIQVAEGYGTTETTGPLCMSLRENNVTGTVGPPLACNQVKLGANGELLAKGDSVMRGYHNLPELTEEAFTSDGWYRTGDKASIDEAGRVKITGRMKEIIVTAGGKNVAPAVLEERLKGHPLVSQVMVVGDRQPFVGALVTLDKEMLPKWLKNHGIEQMDITRAARDQRVLDALERAVKRTNRAVSRAESIRKIKVLTTDFTVENELLTPSQKLKRERVAQVYAAEIQDLYSGPKPN